MKIRHILAVMTLGAASLLVIAGPAGACNVEPRPPSCGPVTTTTTSTTIPPTTTTTVAPVPTTTTTQQTYPAPPAPTTTTTEAPAPVPPVAPPVTPPSADLPVTGSGTGAMALLGFSLVGGGLAIYYGEKHRARSRG